MTQEEDTVFKEFVMHLVKDTRHLMNLVLNGRRAKNAVVKVLRSNSAEWAVQTGLHGFQE